MEAEYNTLSMTMQDAIPLRNIMIEVSKGVVMSGKMTATFKTTVWEDNKCVLNFEAGNNEARPNDPKVKGIWSKISCFRSKLKPNEIEVKKIAGVWTSKLIS
jgi:hypothetical protein